MKTIKIIDLLNMISKGEEVPKEIILENYRYHKHPEGYFRSVINSNWIALTTDFNIYDILNNEVEIIEEEKKLHANDIEFNINNDKKDCIITLDENDLGIDKLHLDNCYFYKEKDKWYVKKYDFKSFKLEEEHKIPEKIKDKYCSQISKVKLAQKVNEILDYLEKTK